MEDGPKYKSGEAANPTLDILFEVSRIRSVTTGRERVALKIKVVTMTEINEPAILDIAKYFKLNNGLFRLLELLLNVVLASLG